MCAAPQPRLSPPEFDDLTATPPPTYTLGVDIGGTFTDVVVLSADGTSLTSKAPTTPGDFSGGVMDAIREAATAMGMDLPAFLARTEMIKHGSTVATNALITRGGVRAGFITTRGFEDTTLIMRAVGRVDGLPEEEVRRVTMVTKPEPLVVPERIRGVPERVDVDGNVIIPLDLDAVRAALRDLVEVEGVDAIAVSLLHAWRNPVHEEAIQAVAGHNFAGFYEHEMEFRRRLRYPPFSHLVRLEYRHHDAEQVEGEASRMAQRLKTWLAIEGRGATDLIGPAPCFYARLDGQYRWQIVVRGPDPVSLLSGRDLGSWRVEVDPPSLL